MAYTVDSWLRFFAGTDRGRHDPGRIAALEARLMARFGDTRYADRMRGFPQGDHLVAAEMARKPLQHRSLDRDAEGRPLRRTRAAALLVDDVRAFFAGLRDR